jgi:hypothetical protein
MPNSGVEPVNVSRVPSLLKEIMAEVKPMTENIGAPVRLLPVTVY